MLRSRRGARLIAGVFFDFPAACFVARGAAWRDSVTSGRRGSLSGLEAVADVPNKDKVAATAAPILEAFIGSAPRYRHKERRLSFCGTTGIEGAATQPKEDFVPPVARLLWRAFANEAVADEPTRRSPRPLSSWLFRGEARAPGRPSASPLYGHARDARNPNDRTRAAADGAQARHLTSKNRAGAVPARS